jgi:hypothetical protein
MLETFVTVAILCNNLNFNYSPRCQAPVDYFVVEENGEAWGYLTNGIPFTQTNVVNEVTRLQKFQMEDYFHYVTDKGDVTAENDLQALSIYLAK